MKTISIPGKYSLDGWNSTVDTVFNRAKENPNYPIYSRLVDGSWKDVTTSEVAQQVEAVARGFIGLGVEKGDRVVLLCSTRYEWPIFDFAIWAAGATTVSVYESSSADQIKWIVENSEAVGIIVENDVHKKRVDEVINQLPKVKWVYQVESEKPVETASKAIVEAGQKVPAEKVHERVAQTNIDDLAGLIYTSGTTGKPKGVMLTHKNFISEGQSLVSSPFNSLIEDGTQTLFFLPLAHVFARAVSIALFMGGSKVAFFGDTNKVVEQFPVFKPSYIVSVPRVFEKIYAGARAKAVDAGKGKIFDWAADTSVEYSKASIAGNVPLLLKLKHLVCDKLVYSKFRTQLGGQCTMAIAGGAPLSQHLNHFFNGLGVTIYEGYGLTESTAAHTVNSIGARKIGTVGLPMNGQSVAIADDGEILLKGDVIFKGYWKNEEATREAVVDGWFHTGDLGSLDEEGYLSITGRKKEIIITAGGKNVSPAALEEVIRCNPLVANVMLVGEQKPFIGAFITLESQAFEQWKKANNKPASASILDLREDADLLKAIQPSIDEANETVSRAEGIKKIRILADDFSIESDELTQSMKVKRQNVLKRRAADFEWMYAGVSKPKN